MFEVIGFYFFSFLTIAMFSIVVMSKNTLYALSALAAGMILISGFFFLLDADFLGVVQIIVYTGAVVALYAFAMMFFDTAVEVKEKNPSAKLVFLLSGLSALLVVMMFAAPLMSSNIEAFYPVNDAVGNVQNVGYVLFTKYLVPFEVAAVMLLVAMVAGIVLAGKKMDKSLTLADEPELEKKGDA